MAELYYVDWDGLVYYDGKIKQHISDELENCIKMGGIVPFAELPDPSFSNLNYIYKITEDFVSNNDFEVPGLIYKAGTWVQVTDLDNVYLYTIFDEVIIGETADLTGYATEQFVEDKIAGIEIPEVPTKVSALENDAGYLTEHQSLEGYARVTDIPDVSNFATKEDIPSTDGLATETYVDEAVSGIVIPDTSNFITMEDVENKGYITEHQDISGKADKSDLDALGVRVTDLSNTVDSKADSAHTHSITEITDYVAPDLSGYALKTDIPSIDGLATEEFVTAKIAEAELNDKEVDLTSYYTKTEVDALIPDTSSFITEVPSEYITEEELDARGFLTEHQSLDGYAKLEDIPSLDDYAKIEDIPSVEGLATEQFVADAISEIPEVDLSGLATEEFVTQKIEEAQLATDDVDLSNYYTKTEVDGLIPDTTNFALKSELPTVPTKVSEFENDAGYLTEHQDLSDYAKKSDIPTDYLTEVPEEYITELELDGKGYLTEHQDISGKSDVGHTHTLSEVTDYVEPDLTPFAKTDDVNTALSLKADSVLFTEDTFVNNALGGFIVGDSVNGLTIAQIIVKLLDLQTTTSPEEPDVPQGIVATIIANRTPMYSQDESGNLVETAFDSTTWTEAEASVRMDGVSTFYQIVNDAGEVIESGYQEATDYNEEAWLTIALPSSVTNFKVEQFDGLRGNWFEVGFKMVQTDDQSMDGYTIWTVPEEYEEMSGSTYRFIIIE